jgi:hypothetical protein
METYHEWKNWFWKDRDLSTALGRGAHRNCTSRSEIKQPDFYHKGKLNLGQRSEKCINMQGDYNAK